jgi:glutathione S-transferase
MRESGMAIVMYDLAGTDDRRFSPFCWRARLALSHKGLAHEARGATYADIFAFPEEYGRTVPVLDDGGHIVPDSTAIADYLEETYPDRPSLFGGPQGRALTRFVDNWTAAAVHANLIGLVVKDIHDHVVEGDRAYFRKSREERFDATLEEIQTGREERLPTFHKALTPLRLTVRQQPFLGGNNPTYADHTVAAAFQWARSISDFRVVEESDPVWGWIERMDALYDGLLGNAPTYY